MWGAVHQFIIMPRHTPGASTMMEVPDALSRLHLGSKFKDRCAYLHKDPNYQEIHISSDDFKITYEIA